MLLTRSIRGSSPATSGRNPLSEKPIRVKDRRMFTTDGEVREEYREMMSQEAERKAASPAASPADAPAASPTASPAAAPPSAIAPPAAAAPAGPIVGPGAGKTPEPIETASGATFQDLIALLAQSASVYLQQAAHVPLEHRAESVELARMHIDLLVILKAKTQGNLDAMEQAVLDDVLYRLRLAAVERT